MSRKMRILLITLTAVIMALVIPTAVAMAQDDESVTAPQAGQFFARVAEIMGIDQGQLEAAFTQAREEMRQEAAGWCSENGTAACVRERLAERQQVREALRERLNNQCTGNATQEQMQDRQQIRDRLADGTGTGQRALRAVRGRHMMAYSQ